LGAGRGGHPAVPLPHHRMNQNATVYSHQAMFFCRTNDKFLSLR
jgi:hypothetical protein